MPNKEPPHDFEIAILPGGVPVNREVYDKLDRMMGALGLDLSSNHCTLTGSAEEIEDKIDAALARAPKNRIR